MTNKKHTSEPVFWVPPLFDEDGVQSTSGIDNRGREHPDPVSVAPPVGFRAPPDLMQMIRTMVQSEKLREIADSEGFDSFEEAEDFDIDDDPLDPLTPYEKVFEPPHSPPTSVGAQGAPAAQANTPPAVASTVVAGSSPQSSEASSVGNVDKVVEGKSQ